MNFFVLLKTDIAWGLQKFIILESKVLFQFFYPPSYKLHNPADNMTQPAWARGTCESYKGKRSMALVPFSRNHVEVLWIILKHNGRSCLNRVSNFLFFFRLIISKHYGCRSRGVRGVQRLEKNV